MVLERVLYERFPFNKNSSLKVWKFQTVHVMVHLVHFGYCSCKQDIKEQNNFVIIIIMERDISVWSTKMTWPIKVDLHLHNSGHQLSLSPGWQLWSPLLKMAGKLSPPLPFFSRGIWKIVVNLQSEIFIPKWAVIISDHAGSLALQWITGWNNTIWADST